MAGRRYFDELPKALKETYPDGVIFSYEGFPIFDDYATRTVVLEDGFITRHGDFKKANQECGFDKTPAGMTWHHKEDGKTLILIDKQLHAQ